MDNILPAYNDPLFSILVIIVLVLIVAISSLVMGRVKETKKRKTLKDFLSGFNKNKHFSEIEEMPFEPSLVEPLRLLAHSFATQGDYQKAINLNLYLIENISNFFEKKRILEQLGHTYLRAGFLKRSESIFLEILHKHPRDINALYKLGIVYELLRQYDKALETIKPLKILKEDTNSLEAHLKLSQLLENPTLTKEEKVEELTSLIKEEFYPYRRVMKALFTLDINVAWNTIQQEKIDSILDILWFLPSSNLNFDIISSDETLSAIYLAKGIIELPKVPPKSNIFSIDTIISAKIGGNNSVDLLFNYGCGKCKQHFPIAFTRCPKCYAIDAIQIKETLAKKQSQTRYSLL